jgi:hypothetical protein
MFENQLSLPKDKLTTSHLVGACIRRLQHIVNNKIELGDYVWKDKRKTA